MAKEQLLMFGTGKGCEVVVGVKRPASDCSSEGEGTKKLKISLNISET